MDRVRRVMVLVMALVLAGTGGASAAPFAFITNQVGQTVSVIDTATNTVTATLQVGSSPTGVAVTKDGSRVYVANLTSNTVSVIDATRVPPTLMATVPVGFSPYGVAASSDGSRVYVTNRDSNTVSVIDSTTTPPVVTTTVALAGTPFGVAVSPDGSRVYVVNSGNKVSVIDTTASPTVIATVTLGFTLLGVVVSSDGSRAYVTDMGNRTLWVMDATKTPPQMTASVPVGTFPDGVAVSGDGSRVYVANSGDNTVSVIDTTMTPPAVLATITVGGAPMGVAVTPDGSHAYVANSRDNTVSVIDTSTKTVVLAVPVGAGPVAFGKFIMGAVAVVVPFSTFIAQATISVSGGSLQVDSTFTLGTGSNGINPLTEPVTITIAPFTTTIPAGSFRSIGDGQFIFTGTINGVDLMVKISPESSSSFRLKIDATGATLTGITSPVTVSVTIGNDGGSTVAQTNLE